MCVAIAGGVKKMECEYIRLTRKHGVKCKLFNQKVPEFNKRIENVDAVILFTGTVSHKMARSCCQVCKKNSIVLKRVHSSSINQLEKVLSEIV